MKRIVRAFLMVVAFWLAVSICSAAWMNNLQTIPEQMENIFQNIPTSE